MNAILRDADQFLREHHFYLPPFAYWTADTWREKGEEVAEIYAHHLGWDITDFGLGDFTRFGLILFTIRNGDLAPASPKRAKTYAEKMLIVDVDQVTPMHFHWNKMEDIINRGGGELAIQLYNATPDGQLADSNVIVQMDGVRHELSAGTTVMLRPGESITLEPYHYHAFWGVGSRVLVGEVSKVNDDNADNRFYEAVGRFPTIDEDEAPFYLLVNDYERYYAHTRR